jgi:hypothetical protein
VMWRVARASVTGDEGLAAQAVQLAETTDSPDLKARAYLVSARVTGNSSFRQRAAAEYERKGNVAAVARLVAPKLPS